MSAAPLAWLRRWLGPDPQLAELQQTVTELTAQQSALQTGLGEVRDAMTQLEKQMARAGKEHFKTNTLAEAQQQAVKTLLEQARTAEATAQALRAHELTQLQAAQANLQIEWLKQLLPTLDGLGEALAAGQRLLGTGTPDPNIEPLRAWLRGLTLMEERLLDLLATADIHPISTQAVPFDPHLHIALDTEPATEACPAGSIVRETRRGYRRGDHVVRYAEVVVAR